MTVQLTLDDATAVPVDRRKLPPAQRWELFAADNPAAVAEVVSTARQLRDSGLRVSIARVWEELRERVHTVGEEYRLDNSLRAPAARALMATYPDLDGVFQTRRTRR